MVLKEMIMSINEKDLLKNRKLLYKSVSVILLTVLGFVFHQIIRLEPAFIAVAAAGFLIMVTKTGVLSSFKKSVIIFL